ncbi:MAG: ATP-binding protein [Aestuariivita sp.]|nr:ATP-binding protein [Aestuariivita sp.]MCY4201601.1 ATP-binding protein [Aestuariivita sp.]
MPDERKLEMTISLNVLEHLGMNLYSNVPAVLSEIVANAWDADARKVAITLDKVQGQIIIDDGIGMGRDEVIDRFLNVGFKRRVKVGTQTTMGECQWDAKASGNSLLSPSHKSLRFTRPKTMKIQPFGWTEMRSVSKAKKESKRLTHLKNCQLGQRTNMEVPVSFFRDFQKTSQK